MRRLPFAWLSLMLACAPTQVPHRGAGPAPATAGDRRVERWSRLFLELEARSAAPQDLERLRGRMRADLGAVPEAALSPPFQEERLRLLTPTSTSGLQRSTLTSSSVCPPSSLTLPMPRANQ
ncbi:MAG: hypothetical protein U1E65_25320 [Myxococcota bacterium]